jgi:predicted AAA+ superfamily ATPase
MTKILLLLISFTITQISFSQQSNETISIGGVTRNYIQYLPTAFDPLFSIVQRGPNSLQELFLPWLLGPS